MLNLPPLDAFLKLVRAYLPQGVSPPNLDPRRVGSMIAVWFGLEILAFSLVAHSLGFLASLALALGTTLLGLSDIRRLLTIWPRAGSGEARSVSAYDGGLSALGAFLLILPGFVSDLAGLALKSPSVRAGLAQRLSKMGATTEAAGDTSVIDLAPGDYRHLDEPKRPARRRRARSTG